MCHNPGLLWKVALWGLFFKSQNYSKYYWNKVTVAQTQWKWKLFSVFDWIYSTVQMSSACVKKRYVKRRCSKSIFLNFTFLNFQKCPINSSMQVKTKSNHYLLWPPFTFKTASIILGTLSCSFIRKPAGKLFQTYWRTCHSSSADFGCLTFF